MVKTSYSSAAGIQLAALLVLVAWPACAWRSSLYPVDWAPGFQDAQGRLLHDFSYAGYRRGEVTIPDTPPGAVYDVSLAPYLADNSGTLDVTDEIQQAIDDAGAAGGGIVYLPPGTYNVAPQGSDDYALRIRDSGIVLRGAGPGTTVVHNTATDMRNKEVIKVRPSTGDWEYALGGTTTFLTSDLTLPTSVLSVQDVSGFSTGEYVVVRTDATADFIADHGMTGQWDGSLDGVMFYRQVVGIDPGAGTLTIDIPTRYWMKTRDNARVYKAAPPAQEVGVEDLSISMAENTTPGFEDGDYDVTGTGAYEVHNSHMIEFYHALNCWVRRVNSHRHPSNPSDVHMLSMGILMQRSRGVTVEDCVMQKPLYQGGGGNGYMFRLRGNDCLVRDCEAIEGRHNYTFFSLYASGNVIHDCLGRNPRYPSDFHGHLSMANLFDVMTMDGDWLEGIYRPAGTVVHGHSTTESVYWNTYGTEAGRDDIVESRAWGWAYIIGTRGPKHGVERGTADGTEPEDFLEGEGLGDTLVPESLYDDQLARRLGLDVVAHTQVVANVVAMTFESQPATGYALEIATDLTYSSWTDTGYRVTGDGADRMAFDPGADETVKSYRLSNEVGTFSELSLFTEDLSAFNQVQDLGDDTTYGAQIVPPVTVFNDGNALRMFDFSGVEKPELQGEFSNALTEPFRIDFTSLNQSVNSSSKAIRFRMSNAGDSVTAEGNVAFSLSWQADGKMTAKYEGGGGSVATLSTSPLAGVHGMTLVVNPAISGTHSYSLFGVSRTLNPTSYDVFVDEVLLNSGFANGLEFTLTKSAGSFDPALGLGRFGLHGSSNVDVDPDYLFDNIVLRTGAVPQGVAFRDIGTAFEPGFAFLSASNGVYVLQSSTNATAPSPAWDPTGMQVVGNGAERILFDPAGFSTGETYRVIQAD